ncbi:MAG: AMP-binding protein [Anaerolineales bacterium]|uniref:AMP-binding protein n=1 Tax=Candidatus Desulfolinea nitratireducens TaxID=2841698 RepID=A0A8J6NIS7_9CHLR|nr:AMP-binding protein [Candidatus Desulfolinea nitratireducens]MBL6961103.1 AMP-binding protein [Anaerolineales bacterium]
MIYSEKPWLKSYKLGPYKLKESLKPYPKEPVFKALEDAAKNYPGQTAVLFEGKEIKYRQLKALVDRLASGLAKLGVEKGDRVCLFLPNCIEFILGDWAVMKTGAAVVPTSILRTDEGLQHEVGSSNSRVIICSETQLERVLGIRNQTELEHILLTSQNGYGEPLRQASLPEGVHALTDILEQGEDTPPQVEIDPEHDLCELGFTGGATGVPKGVMITHANRYNCIRQGLPWLMEPMLRGFAGKASVLVAVPLFHTYGHYVYQSAAYLGMRAIVLPDPRDTTLMARTIQEFRPFLITGVPTQFMRIAQEPLPRLNSMFLSGSAPLPVEVSRAVQQKTGVPISEGYGLTETSTVASMNVSAFSKITGFMQKEKPGIGIPTPDTECKLVDPDTGEEVPLGEPGEIVLRGPQVMKGYWPKVGSGLTETGWLHTGDIAVMDEDGYMQLVDRIKDMVNISGMKVYTTTVDEVLFAHPAILMAAAFGVPDPDVPGSERVMAVIQLKEEYKGKVFEAEIIQFCKSKLAPYAIPKTIELREELPLTVTEKVFKKVLRDEVIEKTQAQSEK